jgi:hypothetical protein
MNSQSSIDPLGKHRVVCLDDHKTIVADAEEDEMTADRIDEKERDRCQLKVEANIQF